jgi:hypothetical protein
VIFLQHQTFSERDHEIPANHVACRLMPPPMPPDEATPQGDNSPSFLQFQFFDLTGADFGQNNEAVTRLIGDHNERVLDLASIVGGNRRHMHRR